jgi:Domain of unknown function (DUF4431)
MPQKLMLSSAACVFIGTMGVACAANAACIDVKQSDRLSFQGTLSHKIFPGPPNFEDVRKGDAREPAYILTLDAPACAVGDDFLNASESFDRIQLLPDDARADPKLSRTLRRLVGKRVSVQGASAFGAHTGHHHAPLLVSVKNITAAPERRSPPQPK